MLFRIIRIRQFLLILQGYRNITGSMKIKKRYILLAIMLLLAGFAFYPAPEPTPIHYFDRQSGEIKTEKVAGEKWLTWLYYNPVGELTLRALVKRKFISSWYGDMMDAPRSADKIEPFVENYDVDLGIAQRQAFDSFNDFFTRKLKKDARPINTDPEVAVSPADGKVLAWADISNRDFIVKGSRFNVAEFLQDTILAKKYEHGSMMLFRLSPPDYHRFHFPVGGQVSPVTRISGDYYSVNPMAIRQMIAIFWENKREYVAIANEIFGEVIMAEVGATMVGSIVQTYRNDRVEKGEEKGYFEFGGSSVVLLFEPGRIIIDPDLLTHTKNKLETAIKMGERVGVSPLKVDGS